MRQNLPVKRQGIFALYFLIPSLIGFIVVHLYPILMALGMSTTEWNLLGSPTFTGFSNYSRLFQDPDFGRVMLQTLYYTGAVVFLNTIGGLFIAILLVSIIKGSKIYRAIYYLPVVTGWVAVSVMWNIMLGTHSGFVNTMFTWLGLPSVPWLSSMEWAMPSIIIVATWKRIGYGMVIFFAGLKSIPNEYYEVADIDGANPYYRIRYITLPLLTPSIFLVIVVEMIRAFQIFQPIFVMTEGGPGGSTETMGYFIYLTAFKFFEMGYASTWATILFIIVMIITLVQWKLQNRWVFYA